MTTLKSLCGGRIDTGDIEVLPPVKPKSSQEWGALIRASWQRTTEGVIETCSLLAAAKEEAGTEGFNYMVKHELPITINTANRMIAISRNPVLTSGAHGHKLPTSWRTLHELSKWSEPELRKGLKHECYIRPDLQRKDVPKLHTQIRRRLRAGGEEPVRRKPARRAPVTPITFMATFKKFFDSATIAKLNTLSVGETNQLLTAWSQAAHAMLKQRD